MCPSFCIRRPHNQCVRISGNCTPRARSWKMRIVGGSTRRRLPQRATAACAVVLIALGGLCATAIAAGANAETDGASAAALYEPVAASDSGTSIPRTISAAPSSDDASPNDPDVIRYAADAAAPGAPELTGSA